MYEDIRQFEFTKVCSFLLGFLSFREKNDFAIRKINYLLFKQQRQQNQYTQRTRKYKKTRYAKENK